MIWCSLQVQGFTAMITAFVNTALDNKDQMQAKCNKFQIKMKSYVLIEYDKNYAKSKFNDLIAKPLP